MTVQSGRRGAAQTTDHAGAARRTTGDGTTDAAAPAFVGRDDALAAVVNALEDGPALVLIEGEAGIGKTRLVREALAAFKGDTSAGDRAPDLHRVPTAVDTHSVLVAACPALEEPFPLGAVVDGIRRLRPDVTQLGLSPLGGALRPLFPEWSDQLPPALETLDDPKETRHRVFAALTELVERLGVEILIVEDAHWADSATLEWLLTVTAAGDLRLPIVVTYRPNDVPEGSLLPRLTSRPAMDVGQVRVELESLDVEQARLLVGSMLGTDEVSEQFAVFLHDRTDGVPLALEETVRLMRDRHHIIRQSGAWTRKVLDELDVPPTIRDSVLERVERLDPTARAVLEAAAVLAAPADDQLLSAVAGLDADTGQVGLAGALRSALLQETDLGRFVFRHVLDAQAVGDAIPVSRRRRLHAQAAQALQQRDLVPVARLARHFREVGDTDAWCHHAEAAADLAWESGDDRTAVVTLLEILSTVEKPIEQRVRLSRKLGEAFHFGTAPTRDFAGQVADILREVLAAEHIDKSERGELRLLLGRVLWRGGQERSAFEEIEIAIPDLDHRPDLAIRAMLNLARPSSSPAWPVERHMQWLDRASELAHTAGSPADRREWNQARPAILLLLGKQKGWEQTDISQRTHPSGPRDEQRLLAANSVNTAVAMLPWGKYDLTRQRLDEAITLLEAMGYQRFLNAARVVTARLDWYTGAWDGLANTLSALAVSDDTEPPLYRLRARQMLGVLDVVMGRRAAGEQRLRREMEAAGLPGVPQPEVALAPAVLGRLLVADGAVEEALRLTTPVVEMIARKGVWLWVTDIALVHLNALIDRGRLDQAETFVSQFADGIVGVDAPAPAAALSTCRAMLAEAHGDLGQAISRFADASAAWAVLPRPYDELLTLERQGRCLLAVAGREDEGLTVLSDAEQPLGDLGAKWDADRVAHVLRQHGVEIVRTWRRGRRGYGDQLSPRELQVVELVARGMTNKQVAETLFISPKTVNVHLSAAMRKLAVSSRTALAMAASEAGLLSTDRDP